MKRGGKGCDVRVSARVKNSYNHHHITLGEGDDARELERDLVIAPKASGFSSSVSGGELLFVALATCYCNDLYREAAGQGVEIERLEVTVTGEFGGVGEPARNVSYAVKVTARGSENDVRALLEHTDRVAEVHNTLRVGTPVTLGRADIVLV